MSDRTRIFSQVWNLAHKFDIPQTTVHSIIDSYLGYCKEALIRGERIDFFGLASVIPNTQTSQYAPTLGFICKQIANKLSLPYHTVHSVMKEYLEDAIGGLKDGVVVEIRGIVTVHPLFRDGKLIKVHSNISQTLKNSLVGRETNVTSFRACTYKSLRRKVAKESA